MTCFHVYCLVIISMILAMAAPTSAFTTSSHTSSRMRTLFRTSSSLQMVSREEYLRPHFHATGTTKTKITTTTTSVSTGAANILQPRYKFFGNHQQPTSTIRRSAAASMEQRVQDYCDNKGGCDLEEMARLMEDFQTLNHDAVASSSFSTFSPLQEEEEMMKEEFSKSNHHHQQMDLKQHLRRMHEIADMEEH